MYNVSSTMKYVLTSNNHCLFFLTSLPVDTFTLNQSPTERASTFIIIASKQQGLTGTVKSLKEHGAACALCESSWCSMCHCSEPNAFKLVPTF